MGIPEGYTGGYNWERIMENGEITLILSFGDWIQRRRKAMDMTRPELAKKVGCAVVTIKKIEQDERKPSRQMAALLAEHLAIPEAVRKDFLEMARGKYVPGARLSKVTLGIPPSLQANAQLSKNWESQFGPGLCR
jgi:transcriptional regulator with XRE-family HTH domain